VEIGFKKVHPDAKKPAMQNSSDAGYDLFSCERHVIEPMERKLVPVGVAIELPFGYYGRIAPRSGLAIKKGIDVLAGVVDSGFRGELSVVLINFNLPESLFQETPHSVAYRSMFGAKSRFVINPGDRIAQLIVERCYVADWKERSDLSRSQRDGGGFGSTGI